MHNFVSERIQNSQRYAQVCVFRMWVCRFDKCQCLPFFLDFRSSCSRCRGIFSPFFPFFNLHFQFKSMAEALQIVLKHYYWRCSHWFNVRRCRSTMHREIQQKKCTKKGRAYCTHEDIQQKREKMGASLHTQSQFFLWLPQQQQQKRKNLKMNGINV